ncbi:MAG: hypothetical protein ACRDID_22460, partial [Ktedonobacterales bacterium]
MSTEIDQALSETADTLLDPRTLAGAIERAEARLIGAQRDGDHWVGELSASALATAIAICALWTTDPRQHAERI